MRVFLAHLVRFRTDDRGVFAVVFAVMALVLVALAGAVIDFTAVQQARTRGQVALDAAALALQPKINEAGVTAEQIRVLAEGLFVQRVNDPSILARVTSATPDKTTGTLNLRAVIKVPTPFVSLVGIKQLDAQLQSEARQQKLDLEVVMVLDNSGSMGNSGRISSLRSAAKCATNILFYRAVTSSCNPAAGTNKDEDVSIAIVPFNGQVNVGPANATQPWIDKTGNSVIANDNFDSDDNSSTAYTPAVDRLALFTKLRLPWRGCVDVRPRIRNEANSGYIDTDDTTPEVGKPNTLFVPQFAPDEPDGMGVHPNSYIEDEPSWCPAITASCTRTIVKNKCSLAANGDVSCNGTTTTTYLKQPGNTSSTTSCIGTHKEYTTATSSTGSNPNRVYTYVTRFLDVRAMQERLCKYHTNAVVSRDSGSVGPNSNCLSLPIRPLTNDPTLVLSTISSMGADGNTNIQNATSWGLRVISPTAPFTEGKPYAAATSKVMIVMTDGENYAGAYGNMNGASAYSAFGYPYNQRLGNAGWDEEDLSAEMNVRTLEACQEAKNKDITVYTIGLSVPTDSPNRALLTNCASDPAKAYFPAQSSDLNEVFLLIVNELMALRLTK